MKNRMIRICLAAVMLWSLFVCFPAKAEATAVNGWVQEGETWYYYRDEAKVTGWLQDGSDWYYLDKDTGAMATGWLQDGTTWYYLGSTGAMVTGSVNIDGLQNRFNSSGAWMGITSSPKMIDILKTIEGFSATPYWDVSQWTVGYGTKCPDDKLAYYKANGISEAEAEALLADMLTDFENAVNSFINTYGLTLQQHQFDALVSFSYNCGSSWTTETTGTFHNAVKNGATGTDFMYAICIWSSAGGQLILTERRMSEGAMYLSGVYEAYSKEEDGTYPENYKYVYMDGNGGSVNHLTHGYDAKDASPILTKVKAAPAGLEFAGWYTESVGGTKVEVLDGSLEKGAVLYAQWKDANGQIVTVPKGEPCSMTVTVTSSVNVRKGPATHYPKTQETQLAVGTQLTLTETYNNSETLWGKSQYGWVCLDYTNYGDLEWPRTGTVTTNGVNVRNAAGTSGTQVIGKLNKGDRVTIYERAYASGLSWGRMDAGKWICLDYVSLDPISSNQDIIAIINPDGTKTGWVYSGVWYYLINTNTLATGWEYIEGNWYYFNDRGAMQTGWLDTGVKYYLSASGAMVTGWQMVDGRWYFFNTEGVMQTGWLQEGNTWYYLDANGAMVTGTVTIGGVKHNFNGSGVWLGEVQEVKKNGWLFESGKWYFYTNNVKKTGWLQEGNTWYYLDADGAMVTGTVTIGGVKHNFNGSGVWLGEVQEVKKTGWLFESGKWYYYANDVKKTGWLQEGSTWYYLDANGAMVTGWQYINNTWYYFNASGAMQTGWLWDGYAWYYLYDSGAMATNISISGGWIDGSGVWHG